MKTVKKLVVVFSAMIKKLFGVNRSRLSRPSDAGEPVIVKPRDEGVYKNVFKEMEGYPAYMFRTTDVQLLRRRLKRYERLKIRSGPAADAALKQLEKQWKRVVRNKTSIMEKEIARNKARAAEQKILPVSGSSESALRNESGLSAGSNGAAGA